MNMMQDLANLKKAYINLSDVLRNGNLSEYEETNLCNSMSYIEEVYHEYYIKLDAEQLKVTEDKFSDYFKMQHPNYLNLDIYISQALDHDYFSCSSTSYSQFTSSDLDYKWYEDEDLISSYTLEEKNQEGGIDNVR